MTRLVGLALALTLGSACLAIEGKVYVLRPAEGTAEVRWEGLYADEPGEAAEALADVKANFVVGEATREELPGWNVTRTELREAEGRLDAVAYAVFDDPAQVGLWHQDRKSPWVWCVPGDEVIVDTNGTRLDMLLQPGCVTWDRRSRELWVKVGGSDPEGEQVHESLLPYWKAQEGGPAGG